MRKNDKSMMNHKFKWKPVIIGLSAVIGVIFFGSFGAQRHAGFQSKQVSAQLNPLTPLPEINAAAKSELKKSPRIVNIINFIRLLEPRDPTITEDVLYQTVVKQVDLMNKYQLKGSFLLQYDALLDKRYQKLLKSLPKDQFEIGGWLEVPQPLAENAGLPWRGNAPWDSRADVDFMTGYTPKEREQLIDTYMRGFKKVFGRYPASVGCWYIDAHSLNYMYTKYGITASCNCKDQIGTDGYTLWGGYWNQAYYPSKKNAYMPAQNIKNQIPVPVFRMLGSDPVRQYDEGIGSGRQGVITLEPVYSFGGGDKDWTDWFFKTLVSGPALAFGYTQAGQENSFTWDAMAKGLEYQFPLIARLRDAKKVKVETLGQSGTWFKKNFKVTPATSVTVEKDLKEKDLQTVWLNSRYYRANLLWDSGVLTFRDIHLFDEQMASPYLNVKSTSSQCTLLTLPFVDGHYWSNDLERAGLRFKIIKNGQSIDMKGGTPEIKKTAKGVLVINWPLEAANAAIKITLDEKKIDIQLVGNEKVDWRLDLETPKGTALPFKEINDRRITAEFNGFSYYLAALKGQFNRSSKAGNFNIVPQQNHIFLDLSGR